MALDVQALRCHADPESVAKRELDTARKLADAVVAAYAAEGKPASLAMRLLHSRAGEMTVSELKAQLAEALAASGSSVLQLVYSLVPGKLLRVDRSGEEHRVISLLV